MFKYLTSLIFFFVVPSISMAGTGFLKGEQTSGLNKICYYEGPSGQFTKTVRSINICPLSADDGRSLAPASTQSRTPTAPVVGQNRGQLSGENTNGLNKTCFYNSPRGTFTKTVRSVQLCPLSATQ